MLFRSEILRGEGDAEAVKVFANAFGQDVEFFSFYRSMQAYRDALQANGTTMVLAPDSEFFRYFVDPSGKARDGANQPGGAARPPAPPRPRPAAGAAATGTSHA